MNTLAHPARSGDSGRTCSQGWQTLGFVAAELGAKRTAVGGLACVHRFQVPKAAKRGAECSDCYLRYGGPSHLSSERCSIGGGLAHQSRLVAGDDIGLVVAGAH